MRDAPNWYARKYHSVVARSLETDPDAEFHIRQIGARSHASRMATVEYGDAFVLDSASAHERSCARELGALAELRSEHRGTTSVPTLA